MRERLPGIEQEQTPKIAIEQLSEKSVGAVTKIFDNAFPDEAGDYTEGDFRQLINKSNRFVRRAVYMARLDQGNGQELTASGADPYVAFRWVNVGGDDLKPQDGQGFAYVPYGGVDANFRGKNIYPKLCGETERIAQEQHGVHSFINEVDRPTQFQITPETSDEDRTKINRIAFFQNKMGYEFIDPAHLETHRPGWDAHESKRDEDHTDYILGFQSLDDRGPQVIERDGKRYVTKDDVRKLYRGFMVFNDIEPDDIESYLSNQLFIEKLDQLDGDLVPLLPSVRPQ